MKEYRLKTAQQGFCAGEAFLIRQIQRDDEGNAKEAGAELALLDQAVTALKQEFLEAEERETGENSAIYETQDLLLEDKEFLDSVRALIQNKGLSACSAVEKAGEALSKDLESGDSAYIQERSEDVRGMIQSLVRILKGDSKIRLTKPCILVAQELSPAALSELDSNLILGIVTAKGAPTSHVAILAENLGVPYLYGSAEAIENIHDGDKLILDGEKLILDPDEEEYRKAVQKAGDIRTEHKPRDKALCKEKDVCRTRIYANITGPQDTERLKTSGAEGVGLFRSEFLFLDRPEAPSEEEQYQAYRMVAEAMGEKETVIRTMDLGSDKMPGWLKLPQEKNPALGIRGIRLSLQEEALFRVQLRAILRAAVYGNVKIMLPMIVSLWEVKTVRQLIGSVSEELSGEGKEHKIPPLGVMIETPAAVMIADELAEKTDFFSIGTNDLTQYTLALDREGEGLERYYDPCHEAVMRMIERTVEAGHRHQIPVAICGELAGNLDAVKRLIQAGIDELSVSLSKIDEIRELVFRTEKEWDTGFSAPADGELIPMEEIPDAAFSSGTLGQCLGILPENGNIYSPCDGVVSSVAKTKHAITFAAYDGRTLLLHVGIDTVNLGGKGMTVLVKEGDPVTAGQKVMQADLEMIHAAGYSPMVIVAQCT